MNLLLRPRWIVGHLLAVAAVVGFAMLGLWQLDRHEEKTDLRDRVAEGQVLPPVPLGQAADGSFRRVIAAGTYDVSLQTTVLRSYEGTSGYHLLTPLVATDGTAVLVDRGWIPLDFDPPDPPAGIVEVEGVLWPAESGSSVPDEFPSVVRRIDPEIQQAFAPYLLRSDYLVISTSPDSEEFPIAPESPAVDLGPHLGYAGQWFLFAAVVLVGYPLLLRRTARRNHQGPIFPS